MARIDRSSTPRRTGRCFTPSNANPDRPAPSKRGRPGPAPGLPLYQHLIDRLADIKGSYGADQESVLRKDLEGLLRPYGFAPEVKGRPDSQRHGYAIGTALLSADDLLQVHSLLKASMERLSDASQKPLLLSLEKRLHRAGLLDGNAARRNHGRRALARPARQKEQRILGRVALQRRKDNDLQRDLAPGFGLAVFPHIQRAAVAFGRSFAMLARAQTIDRGVFLQAHATGQADERDSQ